MVTTTRMMPVVSLLSLLCLLSTVTLVFGDSSILRIENGPQLRTILKTLTRPAIIQLPSVDVNLSDSSEDIEIRANVTFQGKKSEDGGRTSVTFGANSGFTFASDVHSVSFKTIIFKNIVKPFEVSAVSVAFDDCQFNIARGRAIYKIDTSHTSSPSLTITASMFFFTQPSSDSTAAAETIDAGGMIYLELINAVVTITGTTFYGQYFLTPPSSIDATAITHPSVTKGGCMAIDYYASDASHKGARVTLSNNFFRGCVSTASGGAVYIHTATAAALCRTAFGSTDYYYNRSQKGGALHVDGYSSSEYFVFSGQHIFYSNRATALGGAMAISMFDKDIMSAAKLYFAYNHAPNGGAVYVKVPNTNGQTVHFQAEFMFAYNYANRPHAHGDEDVATRRRLQNMYNITTEKSDDIAIDEGEEKEIASPSLRGRHLTSVEDGRGGGIYVECPDCSATTTSTIKFKFLQADKENCLGNGADNGGFIYSQANVAVFGLRSAKNNAYKWGGSILAALGADVYDSTFTSDEATGIEGLGGGVMCRNLELIIGNSHFTDCRSGKRGGAVSQTSLLSATTIDNTTFTGNRAFVSGQAIDMVSHPDRGLQITFRNGVVIDGQGSSKGVSGDSTVYAVRISGTGLTFESSGTTYRNNAYGAVSITGGSGTNDTNLLSYNDVFDEGGKAHSIAAVQILDHVNQVWKGTYFAGSCNAEPSAVTPAIEEECNTTTKTPLRTLLGGKVMHYSPSYFGCATCPLERASCTDMPTNRPVCKDGCSCSTVGTVPVEDPNITLKTPEEYEKEFKGTVGDRFSGWSSFIL